MRILLTGFEPFGGETINPSKELIQNASELQTDRSFHLETLLLPVELDRSWQELKKAIDSLRPDKIVSLGQAAGRSRISLEKVALNWLDFEIPDNQGSVIRDRKILNDVSVTALFARLPLRKIESALQSQNIPVEISYSAGTFICNYIMFLTLNEYPQIESGFVHLPFLPEQGLRHGKAHMSLETMQKGVSEILSVLKT